MILILALVYCSTFSGLAIIVLLEMSILLEINCFEFQNL
jgi:hypothetical protein